MTKKSREGAFQTPQAAAGQISSIGGIARMVEAKPAEVIVTDAHPMDHDDPNAPMFGLSPEDQAIEDERRRTQPNARRRPRPGRDEGEG